MFEDLMKGPTWPFGSWFNDFYRDINLYGNLESAVQAPKKNEIVSVQDGEGHEIGLNEEYSY